MQKLENKSYSIKLSRYFEDKDNGLTLINSKEETTLFEMILKILSSIPTKEYMNEQGEVDPVKFCLILNISNTLSKDTDEDAVVSFENAEYDRLMELTKKLVPGFVSKDTYEILNDLKQLRDKREAQKKKEKDELLKKEEVKTGGAHGKKKGK